MVNAGVVKEFRGQHSFLSNFYPAPFTFRGDEYPTAEHAFQAMKCLCLKTYGPGPRDAARSAVLAAESPAEAKRVGGTLEIDVTSWDRRRVDYMREVVYAKFNTVPGLAGKLINTGAAMLVEGNTWGDCYWGRCNGKGLNALGVILMEVRGRFLYGALDTPPPF